VSRRPGTPRLLREINDRSALDLLIRHGSLTRTQLVAATGLSKPTASQLLARLQAAGLVALAGTSSGGRGPSAEVYEIDPSAGSVVGVDVAPRRIVAAVADIRGEVIAESSSAADMRRSADPAGDVAAVVRSAVEQSRLRLREVGRVVIASPGVHDRAADQIKHAEHMTAWARTGVVRTLTSELRLPVSVENDVNVVAVAERAAGAATDVESFALLWVSAGLGLAIDLGGTLHRGATGGAGEVGYMPLPGFTGGGRGRNAEFQTLVSERAIVSLGRQCGVRGSTAERVVRRAVDEPANGRAFLVELAERLATGIAMIVSVLDPEMVVLAGSTSLAGGGLLRQLIERRLRALTPLRPNLALSAVDGNPVLAGALQVALAALRDDLFTSVSPASTAGAQR
jgi:predicted NBD/HSP70 family sugar kinase